MSKAHTMIISMDLATDFDSIDRIRNMLKKDEFRATILPTNPLQQIDEENVVIQVDRKYSLRNNEGLVVGTWAITQSPVVYVQGSKAMTVAISLPESFDLRTGSGNGELSDEEMDSQEHLCPDCESASDDCICQE